MRIFSRLLLALTLIGMAPVAAAQDTIARAQAVAAANQAAQAKTQNARSAFAARLRQAALVASAGNPASRPPLSVPAAWVTGTAYVLYNVVASNGHYYANFSTSCTSGATAPSHVNSGAVSDGGCIWTLVGDPERSASDALAPTLTTVSGASPFGGTTGNVLWSPITYPQLFTVTGASTSTTSIGGANFWQFTSFNNRAGGGTSLGAQVCFGVTDNRFALGFANLTKPVSVTIDGVLTSPQPAIPVSGNPNWQVFTFASKALRNVCWTAVTSTPQFYGVATTTSGSVQAAAAPAVTGVCIADSYDAGSGFGPNSAYGSLCTQIGWRLGIGFTHMAQGGSGVQNTASAHPSCSPYPPDYCYTYPQRVADSFNASVIAKADVCFLYGSSNDGGVNPVTYQANVLSTVNGIRAVNRSCLIVWVGPPSINNGFSTLLALDQTLGSTLAGWTDPAGPGRMCYVPFAASPTPPIDGSYRTGAPPNVNTVAQIISGNDNTHPIDYGTRVLAKWMADQVQSACYAAL